MEKATRIVGQPRGRGWRGRDLPPSFLRFLAESEEERDRRFAVESARLSNIVNFGALRLK